MKSREMCVRLMSLGLTKEHASSIISDVKKWTNNSGPEWTVNRLKKLKLELITHASGSRIRTPWVSRSRDGNPKGHWGTLFRWVDPNNLRSKRLFRSVNALMAYSTLYAKEITDDQHEKFFSSMESSDTTGLKATLKDIRTVGVGKGSLKRPKPFVCECTSPTKKGPTIYGKTAPVTESHEQFKHFSMSTACSPLFHEFRGTFQGIIPEAFFRLMEGDMFNHVIYPGSVFEAETSVGSIGFIQEPGYKLRAVANPNRVIQAALSPLKDLILEDLKRIDTDCTHDQMKGVERIKGWLRADKTCYSVDLSDATNLMPRHLQMDLLRKRYRFKDASDGSRFQEMVDVFDRVSSSPWYYKGRDGNWLKAKFTRGQPLGLAPSFPAFALAHNVLLEGICNKCRVKPHETFVVLGDDVCISNAEVHRRYRATLDNLGCKVSEAKTLVSKKVAEFAGKIIIQDMMVPQFKWKQASWASFMDVARNYGPEARRLLTPGQRHVVDAVAKVPECLGGMGWNPDGLPLESRLQDPIAQSLFSVNDDDIVIPYQSLASLVKTFFNGFQGDHQIPHYDDYTVEQALRWAPDVDPTRTDLLRVWDHPLIRMDQIALEDAASRGTPVADRQLSPQGLKSVNAKGTPVYIPMDIFASKDPRIQNQTWLLALLQTDILKSSEIRTVLREVTRYRADKLLLSSREQKRTVRGTVTPSIKKGVQNTKRSNGFKR